jgi:hypothetical protein
MLTADKADAIVQVKSYEGAEGSGLQPHSLETPAVPVPPSGGNVNTTPSILGVPRVSTWYKHCSISPWCAHVHYLIITSGDPVLHNMVLHGPMHMACCCHDDDMLLCLWESSFF